jgi:exopolyphosphatase / guanosine-5'-triphosphate,3'-diphosphate pyrophosphatase
MRVSVFDIGTNSIHMLVVEIQPDLSFKILDREKDTTRLGDGSFEKRRLKKSSMRRALNVIGQFHRAAKKLRVRRTIGVATSAVRDAKNGKEFIREIYKRTGARIRIVSGDEEGRLIELAARSNMDVKGKKTLVVDIGGGSMELILGDGKKHFFLKSFPLGVARLTDHFLSKDPPSAKQLRKLEKHVEKTLKAPAQKIRKWKVAGVIGTAGTMINLASMVYENEYSKRLKLIHHFVMQRRQLEEIHSRITNLSLKERLNFPGLDAKRADIILAGSVLVRTLMRLLGIERITVSKQGIREGVILDFIDKNRKSLLRASSGRIPAGKSA